MFGHAHKFMRVNECWNWITLLRLRLKIVIAVAVRAIKLSLIFPVFWFGGKKAIFRHVFSFLRHIRKRAGFRPLMRTLQCFASRFYAEVQKHFATFFSHSEA